MHMDIQPVIPYYSPQMSPPGWPGISITGGYFMVTSYCTSAFANCATPSPTPQAVRKTADYRHAMAAYRACHTNGCAWCGRQTGLEVHHVVPVHVAPGLAADTNNYIMLDRKCHEVLGHARNYRTRYVSNVVDVCRMRVLVEEHK